MPGLLSGFRPVTAHSDDFLESVGNGELAQALVTDDERASRSRTLDSGYSLLQRMCTVDVSTLLLDPQVEAPESCIEIGDF
jgi:hypothetical protein